jgi:hypothetical protein
MIHITRVDLSVHGIELPHDRVGMVVAQPYLSLTQSEPFRCSPGSKEQHLASVAATLDVALQKPHGEPKTHFTIFPEYSIPGIDGIALIEAALADAQWPTGTVVIGGVDALSKGDFQTLAGWQGSHFDQVHNSLDRINANEWINCEIIWVKGANFSVERWLQPKLWPAWPENIVYENMFRGRSIFAFKGPLTNGATFRFSSLVCFDWIAVISAKHSWQWMLEDLSAQATAIEAEFSLSWLFVIEHNARPSHEAFLRQVSSFYSGGLLPRVRRERACIVFANTAGKPHPGRSEYYGGTSLIFTQRTPFKEASSRPTFAKGGVRFRLNGLLDAYRDVYFREKGACIHSFAQINPDSVPEGPEGRTFAIDRPFVFPLAEAVDPRTPSNSVAACVKWINDELDDVPGLDILQADVPLGTNVGASHQASIAALRALSAQSSCKLIKLATAQDGEASNAPNSADNADEWGRSECDALHHVVHTVELLGLCCDASAADQDAGHGKVTIGGKTLDLVAVRGKTHEQCSKHALRRFTPGHRRQVLLVTRDHDNAPLKRRARSILQPESPRLGADRNITDPESGTIHIDYQGLLGAFQDANTVEELAEGINARIA